MESHMDKKAILLVTVKPEVEATVVELLGPRAANAVDGAAAARAAVGKGVPPAVVLGLADPPAPEQLDLARDLSGQGIPVIVMGARKDPDLIREVLRAGARDYLAAGEEGELGAKLLAILEARGDFRPAQVTALFPAKGGMGATSLATHLAGALARQGKRVCLVDLDFELGDVLSFLDMAGTYSLADVAANTHRLDRELLDASVLRHVSGVWVLSQCDNVSDGDRLDPGAVAGVLRFLRRHYDHIVVDGLRDFGDTALSALDVATRIALVLTQEVPAVRSAQRCAAYFRQLGYEQGRLMLVVNRNQRGSPITREVIEETVGLPVAATVANDFGGLSRAVNRGVLLWDEAPRSPVIRDVEAIASGFSPAAAGRAPAGFFQKLFAPRATVHGID
jgi:pilus assembly protein CpaE